MQGLLLCKKPLKWKLFHPECQHLSLVKIKALAAYFWMLFQSGFHMGMCISECLDEKARVARDTSGLSKSVVWLCEEREFLSLMPDRKSWSLRRNMLFCWNPFTIRRLFFSGYLQANKYVYQTHLMLFFPFQRNNLQGQNLDNCYVKQGYANLWSLCWWEISLNRTNSMKNSHVSFRGFLVTLAIRSPTVQWILSFKTTTL